MVPTLSLRAVSRATLDRQLLLRRHSRPALRAVTHLAGLQAQAPLAPYVGLWTRLDGFDPEEISTHLSERTVVRAPVMRGTVHLVDAADFVAFRPLFGPLMASALRANYTRRLADVDLAGLVAEATAALSASPLTRAQLGRVLAPRWPDADPLALAYAATYLVPVVQLPPRGIWGKSAQATWLAAGAWLAHPSARPPFPRPHRPGKGRHRRRRRPPARFRRPGGREKPRYPVHGGVTPGRAQVPPFQADSGSLCTPGCTQRSAIVS